RRVRNDVAACTIQAPEPLAQRIEGSKLRDKSVEVDIDTNLDALRGNDNQRALEIAVIARSVCTIANRSEISYQLHPIHSTSWSDHQNGRGHGALRDVRLQYVIQPFEYGARPRYAIHHHAYRRRAGSIP